MSQLYYDALFCMTFMVVLLAMVRVRKTVFKGDKDAFVKMIIGVSFLTGFSILQLLGNQQVFAGVPYLEATLNRKMIEAVGIVGGLIFLLVGLGSWLPSIAHGRRERVQINKRYHCLKMISQSLRGDRTADRAYKTTMHILSSYLGIPRCAAFSYSKRTDVLYLSGATGFTESLPQGLRRLDLADTDLKAALMRFRATRRTEGGHYPLDGRRPDVFLPVAYDGRLYGALMCWLQESAPVDDDFLDFLSVIGGMLGRHVGGIVTVAGRNHHQSRHQAFERLNTACNGASTVMQLVPDLFRIIREVSGAEFLSVAVLDHSGENMRRYSIGSGGRLLLEKGVSSSTLGTEIHTIFKTGDPILKADVDPGNKYGENDGLFLSCGMRSKLSYPVIAGGKTLAILTLGNSRPGHFTRRHQHLMAGLPDTVAAVIQREQLRHALEVKEDQMLRLQLMERTLSNDGGLSEFFDAACNLLTERMRCTMARISLVDKDRRYLVSQACHTIRDTGHDPDENRMMPLSLLPWHKMIIDAEKPMLINQDDAESRMPVQESTSALLPEIRSAMLVPIIVNQKVKGVISIGEMRNWNRRAFGAADLILARDLASKCAVALRLEKLRLDMQRQRTIETVPAEPAGGDRERLRSQLTTPLTSIIGAVELLKVKSVPDDFSRKYHNLILTSANRIKAAAEDYTSGISETEETEPEMVIG